jgi:DNA-formamidopyrimidine glycosylase
MPEGHVTHRLAEALTETFGGRLTASSSPQGRFADGAAILTDRTLAQGDAFGKHLLVAFDGLADRLHIHLGTAGKLGIFPGPPPTPVGAVRWRLTSGQAYADLRGPAACDLLAPVAVDALLARLGPDPLRPDADADRAWARIHSSRAPMAVLLMDQSALAGVGNIFRAEVLFRHRIDPWLQGRLLRRAEWDALWDDLVELMEYAVARGRIDSVLAEHEPEAMGRPPRVDRHGGEVYVYRRAGQACHVCGTIVRTEVVATRNLFWCPVCQRRSRRRVPSGGSARAGAVASTSPVGGAAGSSRR